ncbi:hypothetical protein [Pseudoteredinibacter isoporae]|uniref:Internalin n=1 Tax=Pseudoteredinibacter isoporae TaxID=570281 RepID=A0A7X0JWX3_9GAMM|nr:hypothetical protein [Pseudoteredinibacter isoporae]MBB6522786.1 hypothetical protein [Pseudoteredinibacter isoporae]NHO88313.1 hypothetical protein [Pseudoteredinibacter isoporae]NIB23356.1 hypothetical protein [Pseudoteredinibacter isoporae]
MAPKTTFMRATLILGLCTGIAACDGYRLSINEQAIGPKPEIFKAYDIPDKNLRNCVSQRLEDEGIQHAGQLDYLNCSHEKISDLTGLAVFVSLAQIDLSSNSIKDPSELGQISQLKLVKLGNNPGLDCSRVNALRLQKEIKIEAKQCP